MVKKSSPLKWKWSKQSKTSLVILPFLVKREVLFLRILGNAMKGPK